MNGHRDQPKTAIVGLGNWLLQDDGVGVHALWALEADSPPGTTLIDGGTAVLHTADLLEGIERVVAIDALQGGGAPGTIYLMDGKDAADANAPLSVHGCGLREALHFMPESLRPRQLLVVGVEPAHITYDTTLSPAVAAVLPRVVQIVHEVVRAWPPDTATAQWIRELEQADQRERICS